MSASKQETVTKPLNYKLDLSLTGRNGDFLCPNCGLLFSPDDETEHNYRILESTVNSYGLESLILRCQRCMSEICLVGLSELSCLDE